MMKKILCYVIFLLLFSVKLDAFSLYSCDIEWMQIDTENVKVIFPQGIEKMAFRIANILNYVNANNTYSIGEKSKKIDLILQTNQIVSNGFVALSPFRSEFYGTGFQNNYFLGSSDWLDMLSLHEYRHVLQFVNADRGLTKLLHFLQGENGWAVGVNLALPNWFLEGDAVLTETVLSEAGRGRLPSFFKEVRAVLLDNKEYSFQICQNGSYHLMVPDYYSLGYIINSYIRNNYGEKVIGDIFADAGSYNTVLFPFSLAVKKHTGMFPSQVYKKAFGELKKRWEEELDSLTLIPTKIVRQEEGDVVTYYNFPQILKDGSIVAIKSSYNKIRSIVHIKDGKEISLCDYGVAVTNFLSENNGKLAWTQFQRDLRRANKNYTRIVVYDIPSKSKRYVAARKKYFSPHYASKSDRIVVVKADEKLRNNLVILDGNDGKILQTIANPQNDFLSFPKWTEDDRTLVFLAKRDSRLAILKYEFETNSIKELTEWGTHAIGSFDIIGEDLYFSASFSGIDNIYSVSLNGDKVIKQVSSVKIGAYEPTVDFYKDQLVFVEYSDMGSYLSGMKIDMKNLQPYGFVEPVLMDRYNILQNKYEYNVLSRIKNRTYDVNPYNGFWDDLRLHSWSADFSDDGFVFMLFVDNLLSDFKMNFGIKYDKNGEKYKYIGDVLYDAYVVQIGLNAKSEKEKNEYAVSFSVPLKSINDIYIFLLQPSLKYTLHDVYEKKFVFEKDMRFGSVASGVQFSVVQEQAVQHIYPRFGITTSAYCQKALDKDINQKQSRVEGTFFLPGLFENHGIKVDVAWQKELKNGKFRFEDDFIYARGYSTALNDGVRKVAVNYTFPLVYPDWGISGCTYFKRLRGSLFYDTSSLEYKKNTFRQDSYGVELFFDNTLFDFIPFSFGIRQSFLVDREPSQKKQSFELVLHLGDD